MKKTIFTGAGVAIVTPTNWRCHHHTNVAGWFGRL